MTRITASPRWLLPRALLSHYRRHPLQAIFLLVGIIIANVLLVATQLINAQAKASYAQGEHILNLQPIGSVQPADGTRYMSMSEYVKLRRAGISGLVPILSHQFVSQAHGLIHVTGTDWLALTSSDTSAQLSNTQPFSLRSLRLEDFLLPPYRLLFSSSRLQQLGLSEGESLSLVDGSGLPAAVIASRDSGLGHKGMMDLIGLQQLANKPSLISSIWVMPDASQTNEQRVAQLKKLLPTQLKFQPAAKQLEQAQLAESLHLNLAAMGLLAFVVGVFLAFNAIMFSYTDRAPLIRRLRLCGVSKRELQQALWVELLLFTIAGAILGYLVGGWLASWLLPGVGQTLAQLYNIYIAYPNQIFSSVSLAPLLMTLCASFAAAILPMRQLLANRILARHQRGDHDDRVVKRDRLLALAAFVLGTVAVVTALLAEQLWQGLLCLASVLLSGAFVLPLVLRNTLSLLQRLLPTNRVLIHWLISDSKWLLGPAAISLMAMTLALVANSGLNTMITSFRAATSDWLEQRLVAPVYINLGDGEALLGDWLRSKYLNVEVAGRHTLKHPDLSQLEIASLPPFSDFRNSVHLFKSTDKAREKFERGDGIYISERHWRLDKAAIGQRVQLCATKPELAPEIVGIYRDYGNPLSQWLVDEHLFQECWPNLKAKSTALLSTASPPPDWIKLTSELTTQFNINDEMIVDQEQIRRMVMKIFDHTFNVTEALNLLTLIVAGVGIFCATSAIHHHRIRQQALLASLGVSQRQRIWLQLSQWGLIGLLCMIIVWPFGTLLAWVLANVVTPIAFGWSFATLLHWQHYPTLALLAIGCLLVATTIPTLRLKHVSVATLLKEVQE